MRKGHLLVTMAEMSMLACLSSLYSWLVVVAAVYLRCHRRVLTDLVGSGVAELSAVGLVLALGFVGFAHFVLMQLAAKLLLMTLMVDSLIYFNSY